MATSAGPNLINDGLIVGLDATRQETKYYPGEPTTNIVPSPSTNGRFTTSNNWDTYNTNQYNGNNDFDIGTIGSVNNNIVTLSSVGHNIRSFDVLNPATTGGGVTAGTNYVIKKISSTTFSLHEYNSSQNGSQGYINPQTGYHKVHDNYATDTRVSIGNTAASLFPDMWHGAPHLPNSGLIKEIVPNGGRIPGTPSMRHHVHRGDNVADGMAYNVYCPVTAGDVITVSFWVRGTGEYAVGRGLTYSTYFGAGNSGPGYSTTITGDWNEHCYTWTASATTSFYSYFFPTGHSQPYSYDIADFQVEINGHATPWTSGTRSGTQGLLRFGTNRQTWSASDVPTVSIANMSFDDQEPFESSIYFDGSDDCIDFGIDTEISPVGQGWTAEYVFNSNSASTVQHFNSAESDTHNSNWLALYQSYLQVWDHGNGVWKKGSTVFSSNTYYHVAFVQLDSDSMQFYVNGVAETGDHVSYAFTASKSALLSRYVGKYEYDGTYARFFNGEIPIVRLYDRPLSAAEIKQSYNVYKKRFNI
tara:strand:+ start:165 stop:1751 length:1587 start_codon:yes stop_codon:yes gene_type:complete